MLNLHAKSVMVRKLGQNAVGELRIQVCRSFGDRFRGLMFRSSISPDEGLLLVGGRDSRLDASIHMLFVPFGLAVIWLNSEMKVVDRKLARPWHPAYIPSQPARYVLEVHPDLYYLFLPGESLEFIDA